MTDPRFTLVSFHAHPDDEALLTGGTLARAAAEGHRVVLVTATDGDRGLAGDEDGHGNRLAALRVHELQQAARALGCSRLVRLGYRDSGLEGRAPDGFASGDAEGAARRLADLLVEERADVLTVYDANGGYGHPDHVRVHEVGVRAAQLAGTPVVLEATVDAALFGWALRLLRWLGDGLGRSAPFGSRAVFTPHRAITHRVRFTGHLAAKRAAMAAHGSQRRADGEVRVLDRMLRFPAPLFALAFGREWFVERGRVPGRPVDDIFASLRPGEERAGRHAVGGAT